MGNPPKVQVEFNSGLFRSSIIERMKQSDLSPSSRLVLLALLDHAHDKSKVWPSITGIEKFTGFKRRAIFNLIKELEEKMFIQKEKMQKINGIGNCYEILSTSAFKTPVKDTKEVKVVENRCIKDTSTSALGASELVHEMHPNTNTNIKKNINVEKVFFDEKEEGKEEEVLDYSSKINEMFKDKVKPVFKW